MSKLPREALAPEPTMDDEGFWRNCAERRLAFQACADCNHPRHPPTPICPACGSINTIWRDAPKRGRVYTYTVVHHPTDELVRAAVPYGVAVVEFPDLPGVRLISNVDCDPKDLTVGLEVELTWEAAGPSMSVPCFRPANAK